MSSPSSPPGAATTAEVEAEGSGGSRYDDVVAPFRLHHALERQEPLSDVQEILSTDPAAVQREGAGAGDWWRGYLPLHIATYWNAPREVVELLVDHYPEALRVPTPHGRVPLHLAAQQGDAEVIELLVDRCPAAIFIKDGIGRVPLQIASQRGAPVGVIQRLSPNNNEGYLSLLLAAQGATAARTVLGVADFVMQVLGGRGEGTKCPPLDLSMAIHHFVWGVDEGRLGYSRDADILLALDEVQCLVERRPRAALERLPRGGLPLQRAIACDSAFTRVLVRRLADACPPALMVKDDDDKGWAPLHAAARWARLDVVQLLLDRCPEALEVKDRAGWRPLHVAARYGTAEVVVRLADACPKALEAKDNIGWLPFHLAVWRSKLEMVQLLADMSPKALQVKDDDGYYPLHIAAERGEGDIFQCVMERWPEALEQRTNDGMRPVHVAAVRDAPLDAIYGMVRSSPLSLQ